MNEKERLQLENELLMTCSKAQAINKYINELEESSKLSELWCKSQQENQELQQRIDKAINYIDQVIMYKPVARELDNELNGLIGILGSDVK